MKGLKHYGIPGMRWGVRKANGGSTVTVGKGVRGAVREVGGLVKDALRDDISKVKSFASNLRKSAEPSQDYAKSRQLKKKPVSKLSNAELKTVITRLQLEKQLKDLDRASVGRGKGLVSKFLANLVAKGVNSYARTQVDPRFVEMFSQMREQAKNKRG